MNYRHEVLDKWPEGIERTPPDERLGKYVFKAKWSATLELLTRELEKLDYHPDRTVIKTFHQPSVVRRDGMLYSNAPEPANPGVVLQFDVFRHNGKHSERGQRLGRYETLQFECDRFPNWKDNVRAIALSLEALRKVERYGVARARAVEVGKRRELPPTYISGNGLTVDDAWAILAHFSRRSVEELMRGSLAEPYKDAMKRVHPDAGGSHEEAARVNVAYEVLKAHLGL